MLNAGRPPEIRADRPFLLYFEMTLYIILLFIALCAGMALSVYAFGTGGKRKRIFQDIYFSVEDTNGVGVLYTKTGEYSAILKIENPVQKYCANIDSYYEFTHLFTALAQTLGEGYALHKQDIFIRKQFENETGDKHEFLSSVYFRYFKGRNYTDSVCYLTITQEAKKSRLFSFDNKKWRDFLVKIRKVHDQLHDAGVQARFLNKAEASEYVDRYFAMNFKDRVVSMTNFKADDETVSMGDKRCKVYSLVDVDCAALPSLIRPYTNIEVNNTDMPVDLLAAIDNIPNAETVVYNQIVFLPNQKRELALLDKKKNRHASIPNPSNQMAVEDIKRVQEVIARESKQLVYTHFNLIVAVPADTDLQKCTNHLENAFGRMGIHISKRAYNQLELFVNSFPGNCYGMNEDYDRFLTLGDAAMCLMYKEHIQHSEETPLKIYYTDRQGVPVAIDITGKEGKNKLTDNSNFFCLGPSGSGKSFHMNSVVRQLYEQGTDVVILLDSITPLARAYNVVIPPTGRSLSGGLDPGALNKPKRFFGSARNIENGGSLTIIATALIDTGSRMDEIIYEEFKGTGNMELHLDRKLSEKRIFPAVDLNRSGTRREDLLMTKDELEGAYSIRKLLSNSNNQETAEQLIGMIEKTDNNADFLVRLKSWIAVYEKEGYSLNR